MNSALILIIFICITCVLSSGIRLKKTETSKKLEDIYTNNQNVSGSKRDMKSMLLCPFSLPINCQSTYKYANFDGSCNNLINPYYGKSETPFKRLSCLRRHHLNALFSEPQPAFSHPPTESLHLTNKHRKRAITNRDNKPPGPDITRRAIQSRANPCSP